MPVQKGGNAQMYNTQGLITQSGYTHTVAGTTIMPPIFSGSKMGGASKKKPLTKPTSKSKSKSKPKK